MLSWKGKVVKCKCCSRSALRGRVSPLTQQQAVAKQMGERKIAGSSAQKGWGVGGRGEEDSLTFKENEVSCTISRKTIDQQFWMMLKNKEVT